MAIISTTSNHLKYQLAVSSIDFSSNAYMIILMNTAFDFDPDTDATLADVTSSQLATGDGYTQDNEVLTGISVTEDDTNNRVHVTWDNVTWTATGSGIGPLGSAIVYDDTTVDDTIIGCIDFGTDYTVASGSSFQLQNILVNIY